jgi:iron(III) transport system permease protein
MATLDVLIERMTPRGPVGRVRRWVRLDSLLPLGLLAVTAFMVVYPLGMVVYGSLKEAAPGQPGAFTLENWRTVLSDPGTFTVFFTTVLIALPRTLLALVLAALFAWIVARTTTPCKRFWRVSWSSCSSCRNCPGSWPGCSSAHRRWACSTSG